MEILTSWWMYAIAALVMVFVISQSLFFLIKASKHAMELGISRKDVTKVITSSMIFSIAPSIAILLGLVTLAKSLGIIIPWIRLSVLGAVTYELPAAVNVVSGVFGLSMGDPVIIPQVLVTVLWVMTLGILPPLIIVPLFLKKIQSGVLGIHQKDSRWGEYFMTAMFLGMISAFLGYVLAPKIQAGVEGYYISITAVLTLITSAAIMVICGILVNKFRQEWLRSYAIPFSMIGSMLMAIVYTFLGVR